MAGIAHWSYFICEFKLSQLFNEFQPLAAIATTPNGVKRLQSLCPTLGATLAANALDYPQVLLSPRVLWVGVGCERGTPKTAIAAAILQVFQANDLAVEAIAGIATIDIKADEVGLVELCRDRQWPLRTFSAERLRSQPVPTPSSVVAQAAATPSVAEAAALCAIQPVSQETEETAPPLKTVRSLLVPKQVFRPKTKPGAVTIAVAIAESEYTGSKGQY